MIKMVLLSAFGAAVLSASFVSVAKADGVQICVDAKDSRYKVDIRGFANEGTKWSGVVNSRPSDAIPNGTNLRSLRFVGNLADSTSPTVNELAFSLKAAVPLSSSSEVAAPSLQVYADQPRVYEMNGLDIICSSTMSQDEYSQMPN